MIRRKSEAPAPVSTSAGAIMSGGWEDAKADFEIDVVHIDIVGPEGSGKTRLALTMPGPIGLINADEKIKGVVEPFVKEGKRIRVFTFGFVGSSDVQETAQRASALWANVRNKVLDTQNWAQTCVADTGTECWELARLGYFGTLLPKGRMDNLYGPVNNDFRTLWKSFRVDKRCNLVTLHQVKDEYLDKVVQGKKESLRTGKVVRAGFKEMGAMANVVIYTSKEMTNDGKTTFNATVTKGWFNAQLEGTTFSDEDARLPYILSEITGLPESRWS